MADETQNPAPAPAVEQAAPVIDQAPVAETPAPVVAEPIVEAAPAPEVKEEALAPTVLGTDPVKPADEKPAEAKPAEAPKADDKPKEEAKPDDKAADAADGEKPAEEVKSEEPAPLPTYEPWVFPEGMTIDDERVGNVNKMFGEFEASTKVDHAAMQVFGQKLLDMHADALKVTADNVARAYQEAEIKRTNDWLEAFKTDPEIGGNRQETTTEAARQFIRTFGGTADQQAEVKDLFNKTGIGNHPAVIRLLANANLVKREGKPVPAQKSAPAVISKIARRYGSNA